MTATAARPCLLVRLSVLAVAATLVTLCAASAGASSPGASAAGASTLREPTGRALAGIQAASGPVHYTLPVVDGRVVRGFVAPAGPYAPGHRGIDLALGRSGSVLAAAGGVVAFAGQVAGRGVIVLQHPDGLRTEYEPVRALVRVGQQVAAGGRIGTLHGTHVGCARPCLHWGSRRGDDYFDPLTLLAPLGEVRLLPWGS